MCDRLEVAEAKKKKTLAKRECYHCGVQKTVMVIMAPGPDGEAWWLCTPCYVDGLRSWKEAAS